MVGMQVYETYPVLAIIALGWAIKESGRPCRVPKYNPERTKTFSHLDWQHVSLSLKTAFEAWRLTGIVAWIDAIRQKPTPHKTDQDCVDACICLLVALYLAAGQDCMMIGDLESGYIVVPYDASLHAELDGRCRETGRIPPDWVQKFRRT
jgi:predicted RNase H-like nuclease